jgi:hypothetical protein
VGKTVRNTADGKDGRDGKSVYRTPKWMRKKDKKKDRASAKRFLKYEEGLDGSV